MATPDVDAGVYIEEVPSGPRPIQPASTSATAFCDWFAQGPLDEAVRVTSWNDFERRFGGLHGLSEASYAIQLFFLNGGTVAWVVRVTADDSDAAAITVPGSREGALPGSAAWQETDGAKALLGAGRAAGGIFALTRFAPSAFDILCLPAAALLDAASRREVNEAALSFCEESRAFYLVDLPATLDALHGDDQRSAALAFKAELDLSPNAAVYFPRLKVADPLDGNRPRSEGSSGAMAGVYARTDALRGVWKAPAGVEAQLLGVTLDVPLTDPDVGTLNTSGINALRQFPASGIVSWGARTLAGADRQADEFKYVPVRRTALFIERSLQGGLAWVVFEPNDEPLWAKIRICVGAFLNVLFRQGAFQGGSPRDAYFVKCDASTTTPADIDRDVVNILLGFAPLRPAEFVVIRLQQRAGQVRA